MRDALVDQISVPWWAGVRPNHRGDPRAMVACGFDFETADARPFALGWEGSDGAQGVFGVTARTALPRLVGLMRREMMQHAKPTVLAFAHVLRYDLGVILYPHLSVWNPWTAREGTLTMHFGGIPARLEYHFGRVVFGKLTIGKRTALIVDTFRYFTMSLDRAAEAVGLALRKLDKPADLGRRRFRLSEIAEYLRQDVRIVTALGRYILAWHRKQDLRPSVSVPQLAMRTFCHVYVKKPWRRVPAHIERAALLAYHAGRNGLYCEPGWRRVKLLDLNSAYPWAMARLPSFSAGSWTRVRDVGSPWGFYWLYRGRVQQTPYPILFDHGFKPLPDGPIRRPVWVTGMELQAALRSGCLTDAGVVGYVWRTRATDRPLRAFVHAMYAKRKAATTAENKSYYKLMMNSLYGKFVSRIDVVDPIKGRSYRAGSSFYPVAASWLTALVRVKLWTMERRAGAVHSATDGVMVPPDFAWPSSTRLGGWKVEAEGWALILRNKFYLLFSDEGELKKCAYHGFDGSNLDVLTMLKTGGQTYRVDRLRGWFEAAARGRRPYVPEARTFRVECPMRGFWPPPIPLVNVPTEAGWRAVVYSRAEHAGTVG